ncbi:MAG: hypothetical protein JWR72_3236, partial [Flavisolibacter sp.]|nr:hypothetical protein [Flavisolibacter sp.]
NYVLPLIFWAHLGLCLYYIEKDAAGEEENEDEDDLEVEYITDKKLAAR